MDEASPRSDGRGLDRPRSKALDEMASVRSSRSRSTCGRASQPCAGVKTPLSAHLDLCRRCSGLVLLWHGQVDPPLLSLFCAFRLPCPLLFALPQRRSRAHLCTFDLAFACALFGRKLLERAQLFAPFAQRGLRLFKLLRERLSEGDKMGKR